jgi:hypothetical protein
VTQVLGVDSQRHSRLEAGHYRCRINKLDLVLEVGGGLWAVEVKLTCAPGIVDRARLDRLAEMIGANLRILVSQTPEPWHDGRRISCNLRWLLTHLEDLS